MSTKPLTDVSVGPPCYCLIRPCSCTPEVIAAIERVIDPQDAGAILGELRNLHDQIPKPHDERTCQTCIAIKSHRTHRRDDFVSSPTDDFRMPEER